MAIDYNAGITSLDTGASDITYSGNQGPKSPDQERQMAFDDTPGFELRSLEELLDEFRQDNNGRDPTSIDDLRRHFYIKYGPQGIAKIDKAVQQAEQQAQMQQREGIQMASAADPMLEEQYQQYVFEMQEQGMQPMSLEEFRQQAVAGMATGGRAGYRFGGHPGASHEGEGSGQTHGGTASGSPHAPGGGGDPQGKQSISVGYGQGKVDPGLAAAAGIGQAAAGFAGTTNVGEGGGPADFPLGDSPNAGEGPITYGQNEYQNLIVPGLLDKQKKFLAIQAQKNKPYFVEGVGWVDPSTEESVADPNINPEWAGLATQIGYVPKYAKPSGIYSDSIAKLGYKKAIEEGVGPKEFGDWLKKDGSIFKESHPDYADTLSKELQISEWDKIYPSENLDVKGRNTEEKQREALNTLMGEVDAAKALGNNKISIESDLTTNYIKNKDKYDDLGITNLEDYKDFLDKAISLNEGGIARLGYKDGEMVTVPKHWQSAPDHPKTELAYITKPEKDLLVKKDLHNSLKDGPNVGPGGVMSLNGDMGIGQSYGDRQVSDKSPEVGDKDGGYTEKGDPGHKEYEKARKARAKDPYYGTEYEGKGKVPTTSVIETPTGVKGYKEEDYKQTLAQKHRAWRAEQARKSFKKLMLHKMKGSPFTLPGFTSAFQGPMDDEEFEKQYGVSYEEVMNMSPVQMEAILGSYTPGSKEAIKTQEIMDDLTRLSEGLGRDDLYDQDVYNEIFYGPKGPPQLGGGGDGPQPIIYPYETASAPGTDTPVDIDPVTGFPTDRIRFASSPSSVHDFTGIYGQRTIPVKDGGRIGYAGGGIADLRQGYFLGKLVKKITKGAKKAFKTIGKIGKSPLGRMGLMALGGWGLNQWKPELLKSLPGASFFMGGGKKNMYKDKWNPWKLGIGAMAAYPLIAGMGKEEDEDFTDTDLYKKWLAQKQGWDQTFAPVGDPANWQRKYLYADGGRIGYDSGGDVMMASYDYNDAMAESFEAYQKAIKDGIIPPTMEFDEYLELMQGRKEIAPQGIQMAAQGGRIGYRSGSGPYQDYLQDLNDGLISPDTTFNEWLDNNAPDPDHDLIYAQGGRIGYDDGGLGFKTNNALNQKSLDLFGVLFNFLNDKQKKIVTQRVGNAQGGRIGYAEGGNDDEEDHRTAALSAMYRTKAQEGGLMDMGGMEKDYRNEGGFVPIGGQERADDVPARLSKNEFVFTADAVRNAGGGDIDKGAEIMENLMENLEQGGKVSEESQGLEGARNMFATSQRLEGVL